MLLPFDFGNAFISIPLNISDIETKEDLDIDKSENFNADVQIYMVSKRKHEEFTVIKINLNTARNDGEKHLYKEYNLYLEFNNAGYNDII